MANGSLNKVILIGNLGADPEVKHFENGGSLARFPIATSESYTNRNGEQVTQTEWHNIVVRGGLVEVVNRYLNKGDKVYVEGRIRTRSWQDQASKETRYTTEIMTDNFMMLGGKPSGAASNQAATPASSSQGSNVSSPNTNSNFGDSQDGQEDDLPF
jgi:single-strand DNA-binding protein